MNESQLLRQKVKKVIPNWAKIVIYHEVKAITILQELNLLESSLRLRIFKKSEIKRLKKELE